MKILFTMPTVKCRLQRACASCVKLFLKWGMNPLVKWMRIWGGASPIRNGLLMSLRWPSFHLHRAAILSKLECQGKSPTGIQIWGLTAHRHPPHHHHHCSGNRGSVNQYIWSLSEKELVPDPVPDQVPNQNTKSIRNTGSKSPFQSLVNFFPFPLPQIPN